MKDHDSVVPQYQTVVGVRQHQKLLQSGIPYAFMRSFDVFFDRAAWRDPVIAESAMLSQLWSPVCKYLQWYLVFTQTGRLL